MHEPNKKCEVKIMDTSKYSESDFVTVELVKNSPTKKCVITSPGTEQTLTFQGETSTKLVLDVEIDNKPKQYTPNKSSIKNIQSVLGNNSDDWVSKVLNLQILNLAGKECIVATVE